LTTELILKPKQLRLEDLPFLQVLGHVDGDNIVLDHSPKGYKLKTPVTVPVEKILQVGQPGLVEYVLRSLLAERPRLIPFVLENQSLVEMARYLLRYRTGSPKTLYVNVDAIARYVQRLGISPDALISDVKTTDDLVDMVKIPKHIRALEDFVGELQDRGLAPSRIANYVKAIRSLYRVNSVDVNLPHSISRRSVRPDRAPKPEELERLLDVADLREKVIVSMLALGGFREGTLARLQYHHVKEDLEKSIIPIHVHVECEITKGKYHEYDTFLGEEAVEYLRLYVDARRQGSIHPEIPPEEISDGSPLIRDEMYEIPRPIGEKQLYKLIHSLYFKAGLLKAGQKGGYDLRVHSIRKFFKTQLMALGVQSDYVDYMMGHTVDTYHDIQSKGVEFLRNIYAGAALSIKPRTGISKIDMVKEFVRGLGLNPEELLVQKAFSEAETKYLDPQERERADIRVLMQAIKADLVKANLSG
jgi:site-specific recombinase XerD